MTIITFDVFFYGLIFLSRCIINDSWPKISLNIKIKLPFAYTFLIPLSFQLFLSSYIRLFLAFCLCNSTLLLTVYLVSNCSQFVHTFFFCRFVLFYSLLLLCSFACLYSTICITLIRVSFNWVACMKVIYSLDNTFCSHNIHMNVYLMWVCWI